MIDRHDLHERIERQRGFFSGRHPGDRLLFLRHETAPQQQPTVTTPWGQKTRTRLRKACFASVESKN